MIDYGYGVKLSPDISDRAIEWRNMPEIYKWCRQIEPLRFWEHENWLVEIEENKTIRMYGIVTDLHTLTNKPVHIGVCGLTSIDHLNQKAEFSLYIQPNYQGQGYGTKALQTLVHHGFNCLNLNRIWGEVFEGNAALEIDKKVGFTVEGKMRSTYFKDGKFIDSFIVSILREEWLSAQPKLRLVSSSE